MADEAEQSSNLTKVVTRIESKTISGQFVLLSTSALIAVGESRATELVRGEFETHFTFACEIARSRSSQVALR